MAEENDRKLCMPGKRSIMQIRHTAIPPTLVIDAEHVYAAHKDIYVIDPRSGVVQQRYQMSGFVKHTVVDGILYVCSSRIDEHIVHALRASDGTHLWQYAVAGRLPDAPTVVNGTVYVGTTEGTIVALQASDGKLIWQYTIDLGPDVPSYLGPILFASPTVSNGVVYVSPAVNKLEPFVYALQASDGRLLWQARIPDSTLYPLMAAGDILYVCTHSRCLALHTRDGSLLWQQKLPAALFSPPAIMFGNIYFSLHDVQEVSFLYVLRASDGAFLWQRQLETGSAAHILTTPAITQEALYVANGSGFLLALQADSGDPLWRYQTGGSFFSPPVVGKHIVSIGANDGCIYAVQATDGTPLWRTCVQIALTASSSLQIIAKDHKTTKN
jgi:outer membrane protein assembly factor BamB